MTIQETFPTDAQTILETVADGVVVVAVDGTILFANPSAHAILERDQLLGRNFGLPFDLSQKRVEVQIVRKSGIGWAVIRAAPLQWHQQEAFVLTFNDISSVKLAWQELELSSQVLRASGEGILISDRENRIISVNHAFTKITGYTLPEVQGKDPGMLASGHEPPTFYQSMWKILLEQGHWAGEIWDRRKNGEAFPAWLSISTVKDEAGAIQHFFAILSDISEQKAAQERIHHLAHFDALTGLPNRILLQDRVSVAISTAQRARKHLAILFIDLDRFKNINDTLGHDIGDVLLQNLSERLTGQLRDEDTLSRLGGDEFVLLLSDTDATQAARVARKLLDVMAKPYHIGTHELNLTSSIGIAIYPQNGEDLTALARAADTALYRAKQSGRNNYQFYTEDMHLRARRTMEIETQLRHALDRGELFLCYQPQVNILNHKLIGMEALIRWHHPTLGIVPPLEFIQIAEDCGMIGEIGKWVLNEAVRQNRAWQLAGLPIVPVAVNLSIAQFRYTTLCEDLAEMLVKSRLPARFLELEITESIAAEDFDQTMDKLEKLCALGVTLSIDDFGTGYSSLSRLKCFKVHKIKIDKSFVQDVASDENDAAIVRTIISMARNLNFRSIAEGVENRGQLEFLHENGCHEVQGFLFSKPLRAGEMERILAAGGTVPPAAD